MKKPKMILFDYGHTLLYEPKADFLRGHEALFKYIAFNKNNLTPVQVTNFAEDMYKEIHAVRNIGFELHEKQFLNILFDYLEIELSIPYEDAERILWDNTSVGSLMPNADVMIDYINAKNIRSGVISNIGWSGKALTERINCLLPKNKFEFIVASSEYMYRKPRRILFELALKKAGLTASDVWFCGDNIKADVEGASAAGIYPVWYDNKDIENPWKGHDKNEPDCEHLHINNWLELIEILESIIK